MIRRLLFAASLLPISLLVPWAAGRAQQPDTTKHPSTTPEPEWAIPTRRLDIYAGARSGDGGTHFMMGGKFSRRIPSTRTFAAAGFFEVTFASPTEYLIGGLVQYMPVHRLLLETGPGFSFYSGGNDFFWRASGEYEMRLRKLFVTPKFYLDFIHGTTVVGYGVAIGRN